jgi:hypothetical protein
VDVSASAILRASGLDAGTSAPSVLPGDHRNLVWTAREVATGKTLIIKASGDARTTAMITREADALRGLAGWPHVPVLRAAGALCGDRPFLVTDALDGMSLTSALGRRGTHAFGGVLRSLASWLQDFSRRDIPSALCDGTEQWSGSWATDYRPVGASRVVTGLVHGSFDPGNVLVRWRGPDLALAGILDFEATRPGSVLADIASMAVRLLIPGRADLCRAWLEVAAEVWMSPKLPAEVLPYSLAQNERRQQAARKDRRVAVADPVSLAACHQTSGYQGTRISRTLGSSIRP